MAYLFCFNWCSICWIICKVMQFFLKFSSHILWFAMIILSSIFAPLSVRKLLDKFISCNILLFFINSSALAMQSSSIPHFSIFSFFRITFYWSYLNIIEKLNEFTALYERSNYLRDLFTDKDYAKHLKWTEACSGEQYKVLFNYKILIENVLARRFFVHENTSQSDKLFLLR